jgi:hypothetical protein
MPYYPVNKILHVNMHGKALLPEKISVPYSGIYAQGIGARGF